KVQSAANAGSVRALQHGRRGRSAGGGLQDECLRAGAPDAPTEGGLAQANFAAAGLRIFPRHLKCAHERLLVKPRLTSPSPLHRGFHPVTLSGHELETDFPATWLWQHIEPRDFCRLYPPKLPHNSRTNDKGDPRRPCLK